MRTFAKINLNTIQKNFNLLCKKANTLAIPMVKCNAYGHGIIEVSKLLEKNPKTFALGVCSIEEGLLLREHKIKKPILVFSNSSPWSDELNQAYTRFSLTPVFYTKEDLKKFLMQKKSLPFHIKFNTGMNRLGIDLSDSVEVYKILTLKKAKPQGLCTHLACSETPSSMLTQAQIQDFKNVVSYFESLSPNFIHAANTQAILHDQELQLSTFCNLIRPGIGLYGYGGSLGKKHGLKPALKWNAKILLQRSLEAKSFVGYGATFQAMKATPQTILAVGYGDGFSRLHSNKKVTIAISSNKLKKTRVLGRVSMDLTSIELKATPTHWINLLGEDYVQAQILAQNMNSIEYEVLTSISARVPRIYDLG